MTYEWTLLAADCTAVADSGWFTQPVATVGAAGIAILGAVVAYLGVTKQTRTTRRESRRAEKVAILSNAWTAVVKYSRAIERVNQIEGPGPRATKVTEMAAGPMGDLSDEYVVAATKLPIYNFGVAYTAVHKLHAELTTVWKDLRANPVNEADETRATQRYKSAQQAITDALESLS